jgi:hypothetical protein
MEWQNISSNERVYDYLWNCIRNDQLIKGYQVSSQKNWLKFTKYYEKSTLKDSFILSIKDWF